MKINGQVPAVAEVRWGISHNNLVFLGPKKRGWPSKRAVCPAEPRLQRSKSKYA